MKSLETVLIGLLGLSVGVLGQPGRGQAGDATPRRDSMRLSGVWRLNREASDDAREKMREAGRAPGAMPGPGSPGGGGMRGPGGGMGGPGGGPPPGGMGGQDPREAMKALFESPERIRITQTPGEIEIDEVDGRRRRFRPNGRTYKTDNGLAETKAEWKEGVLRVQTTRDRGPKVVEAWEISPDGHRLTVRVTQEGTRFPEITLKRVYDRSGDEAPAPNPR